MRNNASAKGHTIAPNVSRGTWFFFNFYLNFLNICITIRTRVIYKRSFCAEVIIGLIIRFRTGLPRTPNIIFFWQGVARYRTVIVVVTTTVWQHLIVWVWMKNYLQPSMVRETLYSLAAITVESDLKTSLLMDLQECNLQKKKTIRTIITKSKHYNYLQ